MSGGEGPLLRVPGPNPHAGTGSSRYRSTERGTPGNPYLIFFLLKPHTNQINEIYQSPRTVFYLVENAIFKKIYF